VADARARGQVGGDYISRNLQCLGTGGRHVSIAFQKGSVARVDFLPVRPPRFRARARWRWPPLRPPADALARDFGRRSCCDRWC